MPEITVVHWNPAVPLTDAGWARFLPVRRRINNFGDLLGPRIVDEILARKGISPKDAVADRSLLTVGSILRLAKQGDTVWGSGANGKSLDGSFDFTDLDVRAVRGPRTQEFLRGRGIRVPSVFGDPGLLVGQLWSRETLQGDIPARAVTVIPNLNDLKAGLVDGTDYLDPRSPLDVVLGTIAASELVVGSSLHAIVVAESLGIPARLVRSAHEPAFKYDDYYFGSGRTGYRPADDAAEAIRLGGEPAIDWNPEPLLRAFPTDLWRSAAAAA